MKFRIDLFEFATYYKVGDDRKDDILGFLESKGLTNYLEDFYTDFLDRRASTREVLKARLKGKQDFDKYREMIKHLYEVPDIVDNPPGYDNINRKNWYYFPKEFVQGCACKGCILNLPIALDYSVASDRPLFRKLFIDMFLQTEFPLEFLDFHSSETFSKKNWNDFMKVIRADFPEHPRKLLIESYQSPNGSKYDDFRELLTAKSLEDSGNLTDQTKQLFDKLVQQYFGGNCLLLVQVMFALERLGFIKKGTIANGNRSQLHRALAKVFGLITTPQSVYLNCKNVSDDNYTLEVERHRKQIQGMI